MMTINLPPFTLGSTKQRIAAESIRQRYVAKLIDRGFDQEDIQNLVAVRCIAKWWLDNQDKLGVMDAVKHFKNVAKLVHTHGTVEDAAEAAITIAYEKEKQTSEYIYNSTPMFKL